MSLDKLSKECGPGLPEPKKEIAIDIMENGDYALTMMLNGRNAAQAFMKPAEAEQFALAILADLEKRRKSPARTTTDKTSPEIRGV